MNYITKLTSVEPPLKSRNQTRPEPRISPHAPNLINLVPLQVFCSLSVGLSWFLFVGVLYILHT